MAAVPNNMPRKKGQVEQVDVRSLVNFYLTGQLKVYDNNRGKKKGHDGKKGS